METQARKERLEKQEEMSRRWKLPKEGQKIVKENHSNWQEKKITEEEKKTTLQIEEERTGCWKKQSQRKRNIKC